MILQETFPRASVFWILIAQVAVYLPHFQEMPLWLTALYFSCLAWRFGIYQGRWGYPNKWLKLLLMVAAFISVYASFQTVTGSKGGVALLLIAFAYKTLEMKEQRDAYLVITIAYFVVACGFLYQRTFFAAGYLFFCLIIVSAALVSMNHLPKKSLDMQGLWLSTKMLLQAVPLMIFLFVFFPQMPPLFQMGLGGKEARTGLSDTMSPGSIAELTKSGELAFRVIFKGEVPDNNKLYWRAQVFERFDGIGWKMSDQEKSQLKHQDVFPLDSYNTDDKSEIVTYEIYQEASDQTMLFSLATGWSDQAGIQLNSDYTLNRNKKVDRLLHYEVESNLDFKRGLVLSEVRRSLNLSLPLYGNEDAKNFAENLRAQHEDERAYIQAVLNNFTQKEFSYTLRPPILGANPIDEFLFDTRKGFCEHFASSFVYLMRAGGLPARIVGGYLGGEHNANGDYLLVHQFEAHAWAEVWLEGEGWVRIDPTAWVAPDRVERGIDQALPEGESILEGNLFSARRYNPLTEIRLQLDYLNMQWDKWVLGYNEEMQDQLMSKLLGEVTATRIALFMASCFAFVVFVTALTIYIKDFFRIKDPADRLYLRMQEKLSKKYKISRARGETPNAFLRRAIKHNDKLNKHLSLFTTCYIRLKYMAGNDKKSRYYLLKQMQKELRKL